jgi:hypothetical protein
MLSMLIVYSCTVLLFKIVVMLFLFNDEEWGFLFFELHKFIWVTSNFLKASGARSEQSWFWGAFLGLKYSWELVMQHGKQMGT